MPERPHILLVEDDAAIVQGLRYALAQDGFAVTALGTAAQARAALTAPGGAGFALLLPSRRRRRPPPPAPRWRAADLTCCCSTSACRTAAGWTSAAWPGSKAACR